MIFSSHFFNFFKSIIQNNKSFLNCLHNNLFISNNRYNKTLKITYMFCNFPNISSNLFSIHHPRTQTNWRSSKVSDFIFTQKSFNFFLIFNCTGLLVYKGFILRIHKINSFSHFLRFFFPTNLCKFFTKVTSSHKFHIQTSWRQILF